MEAQKVLPAFTKTSADEALDLVVRGEQKVMLLINTPREPENWFFDELETDGKTVYVIRHCETEAHLGYASALGKKLLDEVAIYHLDQERGQYEKTIAKINQRVRNIEDQRKRDRYLAIRDRLLGRIGFITQFIGDLLPDPHNA